MLRTRYLLTVMGWIPSAAFGAPGRQSAGSGRLPGWPFRAGKTAFGRSERSKRWNVWGWVLKGAETSFCDNRRMRRIGLVAAVRIDGRFDGVVGEKDGLCENVANVDKRRSAVQCRRNRPSHGRPREEVGAGLTLGWRWLRKRGLPFATIREETL